MARPRSNVSRYKHLKNDKFEIRKAVLYARVSTPDQQREGYSIPAQVKLLEDYAALNGIIIVSSHVDVETARKSGRTAFGDMLRYLRRTSEVRIILVEKTDRLYRNLKDWATIDDLGIEVHFVKENVVMFDGCRSSEKFVHGIKVLMAKAYIDNLSEETRKGMLEKARQGHWPTCAPLGYLNVQDGRGRNIIVIDPKLGPMVTRLFDWYATGLYSLKDVTAKAHAMGMHYRKSGRPIAASTVLRILRNRLYSGSFEWIGEVYHGVHEPLVSSDMWNAVQQMLDGRAATNTRAKPHFFPFTGLVKCGHCDCSLVAQMIKGRYVYYHCSGYRGKCPERYLRQEALEEHFLELLKGLRCSSERFAIISDEFAQVRCEVEADSGETTSTGYRVPTDTRSALLRDGLALLAMGRTAHLQLASLTAEMKRQVLGLIFLRCSWANGQLTGWFNSPFEALAELVGKGMASRDEQFLIARLSGMFHQATPDARLLVARYNAMIRTREELVVDTLRLANDRSRLLPTEALTA